MSEASWYLRTQDETFGPETEAKLIEWARLGRIQPGQEVSDDNIMWRRVEDVPFLDMRFSIDIGDGNPRGPFNRVAAEALLASGRLPPTASLVETRAPFEAEEPAAREESSAPAAAPVQAAPEVPAAAPEPDSREVRVVVDETRVKELEGLLDEERRHTADLQKRFDESSRNAAATAKAAAERESELMAKSAEAEKRAAKIEADARAKLAEAEDRAAKFEADARAKLAEAEERAAKFEAALRDAADRESKYEEQVRHLEDELRRLPQAASEVADIQVAVYSLLKGEAEEIARTAELEKREFEELRKRYAERAERLQERRREILKRSGSNIEEMTRKALHDRPEDPRTVQLRKEFDALKRASESQRQESAARIRELEDQVARHRAEDRRMAEGMKDVTQLRQEIEAVREQLRLREKELLAEKQRNEELSRAEATRQQVLLARLATLESPSIGTVQSLSTNQSREAKQVKLPSWMRLGK